MRTAPAFIAGTYSAPGSGFGNPTTESDALSQATYSFRPRRFTKSE